MNRSLWFFLACLIGPASVWGLDPMGATPSSVTATTPKMQRFAVHSGRDGFPSHYVPSGYMGDIGNLALAGAYVPTHDGVGTPLKVTYRSQKAAKGWSGLYWQHPANNWGDRAGRTGFDLRGATRLTFWARGEKGGEKVHEVRVGGIVGRYPDSDSVTQGPIELTPEWKMYEINLSGLDLRHVIGGFAISLLKRENAGDVVFYIDDIGYEMPTSTELPQPEGKIVETTGDSKVATLTPPSVIPKDLKIKTEEAGLRVSVSSQFLFSVGKTSIRPESSKILDQVVEILKAYPGNDVLVEGHTDNTGNATSNLALSKLRGEAVRDYLVKKGGFDLKRFRVVGYGQTQPIDDNATPAGRAHNRRVEVIILKKVDKL